MVFDSLIHADRYASLHPQFAAAFAWLRANPAAEPGKYPIVGEECFALVQVIEPAAAPPGPGGAVTLEAHRRFIDIQVGITGTGPIGWKPLASCTGEIMAYDAEKDAQLWKDTVAWTMQLAPGEFTILFPEDAHAPLAGPERLLKVVVKVAVV